MSNANDQEFSRVWGHTDSIKPTEKVVKDEEIDDIPSNNDEILPGIAAYIANNPSKLVDSGDSESILTLAAARIGERRAGYTRENAFMHIARRWNVWMENRGEKFRFSPCDVAALMVDFKIGRMEARLPEVKTDDFVDACGYLDFAHDLR